MENIESIILPDFKAKKTRPKKENKKVLVEKETLPRTNRTVVCKYCESDRILNPDQYQSLFDLHGSEEKVAEEFCCKPCEMIMKNNPFYFWVNYGDSLHILSKNLKTAFDIYKTSSRSSADAVALQNMTVSFMKEVKISDSNFEFIIVDRIPVGMKIKNFPFVGEIILNVYENKKQRITING
jgi:hypothetical protein